ncbi:hypothetical protein HPG69_013337 [Diceros bicornis minor]|uniref:Uncharacterized protein n=1 Tax=Diceros bicornis minor TaxID=77932 RepID=A0A7J7F4N4_DICBM|nr:hypothetical protein HPG69_013337 [Diceros bicornis minor]
MGFTGAGIATGSIAAKMMSAAAIANGGGVAAGSLVATLQSVGAAGLSASSSVLLGFAGSAFGGLAGMFTQGRPKGGPKAEGDQPGENASQGEPPKPPLRSEKPEK